MAQINFRVDDSLKLIIDILAKEKGISIAQLAKDSLLKNIEPIRVDLAFELLKKGKIGRKKAWKISGLEYSDFLKEWRERGAEENIKRESIDTELAEIEELVSHENFKKYMSI